MNTKMLIETLVRDHMIHMIELFNKIKILKLKIDEETKVDMVFKTLLNSFKKF